MRRFAGFAVAALVLAPGGLRLASAASGPDAAVILCAIACGHEATPGAVCCPMRPERATGPSFQTCGGSGASGVVAPPAAQPGLLPVRATLSAPAPGPDLDIAGAASPLTPALQPPDHVPLLLS